MNIPRLFWILTVSGILGYAPLGPSALAQGTDAAPRPELPAGLQIARLTVLTADGKVGEDSANSKYELGKIDPLKVTKLEREFILRNDTKEPITIARLHPSCGCESLFLTQEGKPVQQPTLKPGEKVNVRVSVALAGLRPGPKRKFVWAYTATNGSPVGTMEIAFDIAELISFNPAILRLGSLNAGLSHSLPFTVTFDERVLQQINPLPPLACLQQHIQVVAEKGEQRAVQDGRTLITRSYRAVVSPQMPVGLVSGLLYFKIDNAPPFGTAVAADKPVPTENPVRTVLRGSYLMLTGDITGKIAATPRSCVFGAIPEGQEANQQVTLTGAKAEDLQELAISSPNTAIAYRLGEIQKPAAKNMPYTRVLTVTVTKKALAGLLQSHLQIKSADSSLLVLPIVVQINPPVNRQ